MMRDGFFARILLGIVALAVFAYILFIIGVGLLMIYSYVATFLMTRGMRWPVFGMTPIEEGPKSETAPLFQEDFNPYAAPRSSDESSWNFLERVTSEAIATGFTLVGDFNSKKATKDQDSESWSLKRLPGVVFRILIDAKATSILTITAGVFRNDPQKSMNLRTIYEDGRSSLTMMSNQFLTDPSGHVDVISSKTEEFDKLIAIHQERVENYLHKPLILTQANVVERLKEHWIRINQLMVTKGYARYQNEEQTICRMTFKGAYKIAVRSFRTEPNNQSLKPNQYSTEEKIVRVICKVMVLVGGLGVVAYLMFADGVYAAIGAPIAVIGATGLTAKPAATQKRSVKLSKPRR